MPGLDIKVEAEAWLKTFQEYERVCSIIPAQALEKKAVRLRLALVNEMKSISLRKGQAKAEMKARGGSLKIRASIRNKYEGEKNLFLKGKHGKGTLLNRRLSKRIKVMKTFKTGENKGKKASVGRLLWKDIIIKELTARQRSRSLLAASWVNRAHKYSAKKRNATFDQPLKSRQMGNRVAIETDKGNSARIVLENFVDATQKIGVGRGMVARVFRRETQDMVQYIEQKLAKAAANYASGAKIPEGQTI